MNILVYMAVSAVVALGAMFGLNQTGIVSLGAAPRVLITDQGGTGSSSPSGILYGDNNSTNSLKTVAIGSNLTFSGGTLSATGGSGSGNVATSTAETSGYIPYWTSTGATPATLGSHSGLQYNSSLSRLTATNASTTSFTATNATTSNLAITDLTSGGLAVNALGKVYKAASTTFSNGLTYSGGGTTCDTASVSVFGCLTAANWQTFNNKWDLASATIAVPYGGTGNTSYTIGNLLYAPTATTLAGTSTANLKTTLALNNVENTALSTWAGSTNITTLGTITSGTWNAGTIPLLYGGTGTTTNRFGGLFYGDGSIFRQASSTGLLDYDPTLTRLTVSNASTTRFSALTKASFGSTATSSFDSAGVLSLASALTVPNGGSGAGTLTGLLIGNGTSAFTATTLSSGISGQLSDETGSGVLVFDTTPTFTTNITDPLLIGGTGAGSTLTLKSTSGSGTTDATIFQVGNNGAVEAGRITTAGEWGLGTTTPHRELVISDSAEPQLAFTDASPTSNIWEMRNAGGNLYFATSSAATQATSTMDAMRLQGGSTAFGIATTSPWRTLSVVGTMAITGPTNSNTGDYLCWNTTTFEVEQSATACSLSSIRWKENIREIDGGLMNILALHPILYDLKPEYGTAKDQPGFIAEEALKATPKLVSYGKDGQVSGYDYPKLTAYLTKAVQELNTKVENLSIGKITESAQDEWQWLVIGLLLMWNLALTLKRK